MSSSRRHRIRKWSASICRPLHKICPRNLCSFPWLLVKGDTNIVVPFPATLTAHLFMIIIFFVSFKNGWTWIKQHNQSRILPEIFLFVIHFLVCRVHVMSQFPFITRSCLLQTSVMADSKMTFSEQKFSNFPMELSFTILHTQYVGKGLAKFGKNCKKHFLVREAL